MISEGVVKSWSDLEGADESWCGSPCHGNAWFLREEWLADTPGLRRGCLLLDDGGSSSSLAWRSSNVPGLAERLFVRL